MIKSRWYLVILVINNDKKKSHGKTQLSQIFIAMKIRFQIKSNLAKTYFLILYNNN